MGTSSPAAAVVTVVVVAVTAAVVVAVFLCANHSIELSFASNKAVQISSFCICCDIFASLSSVRV